MPDIKIIMFAFQKASNMKSYVMALCEYFEILLNFFFFNLFLLFFFFGRIRVVLKIRFDE